MVRLGNERKGVENELNGLEMSIKEWNISWMAWECGKDVEILFCTSIFDYLRWCYHQFVRVERVVTEEINSKKKILVTKIPVTPCNPHELILAQHHRRQIFNSVENFQGFRDQFLVFGLTEVPNHRGRGAGRSHYLSNSRTYLIYTLFLLFRRIIPYTS